jgi:hypothetical protein
MGRKSRLFAHLFSSLDSRFAEVEAELAESLRPSPQIFPFWRDHGGDRFDHDCRPRGSVGSAATSPPLTATLFTGR